MKRKQQPPQLIDSDALPVALTTESQPATKPRDKVRDVAASTGQAFSFVSDLYAATSEDVKAAFHAEPCPTKSLQLLMEHIAFDKKASLDL
jgi:hypothetical protein